MFPVGGSQTAFVVGLPGDNRAAPAAFEVFQRAPRSRIFYLGQGADEQLVVGMKGAADAFSMKAPAAINQTGCVKPISAASYGSDQQRFLNDFVLCAIQEHTHADVALIQERDTYWTALKDMVQNGNFDMQKTLDAVLWKGDFLVVLPVTGADLLKVLKESDDFRKKDTDNLSIEKERNRALLTLGIVKDSQRGEYLINHVPLDAGKVYAIATTDYISNGDTGYPELATLYQSYPPRQYTSAPLELISTVVCQYLRPVSQCNPSPTPADYFDQLAGNSPADPRPGKTLRYNIRQWSLFGTHYKDPIPTTGVERSVQDRPIWSLAMEKMSISYSALFHRFSEPELSNLLGGVQASDATTARYFNWNVDEKLTLLRSYRPADFFASQDLTYIAKFTATDFGPAKPNQSTNALDFDTGTYLHPKGRIVPHYDFAAYLHFYTQAFTPIQTLTVTPVVPNGPKALNFELGRTFSALGRLGPRYHDRHSYIEAGIEGGSDFNAIESFQFKDSSGANIGPLCFLTAEQTLQACAKASPAVNTDSHVQVGREGRQRTGLYWHGYLNVPVFPKVSESFEDQGDFFFNNSGDNSTDTRLHSLLTNKITFQFLPNLAFSPTYQLLLYENKVGHHFLWQQQAALSLDFYFNLTNLRIRRTQLEYKPPAQK
jgi:hypothetical protein